MEKAKEELPSKVVEPAATPILLVVPTILLVVPVMVFETVDALPKVLVEAPVVFKFV